MKKRREGEREKNQGKTNIRIIQLPFVRRLNPAYVPILIFHVHIDLQGSRKKEEEEKKYIREVQPTHTVTSQTFFIAFRYGREMQAKIKYDSKQNLDSITGISQPASKLSILSVGRSKPQENAILRFFVSSRVPGARDFWRYPPMKSLLAGQYFRIREQHFISNTIFSSAIEE